MTPLTIAIVSLLALLAVLAKMQFTFFGASRRHLGSATNASLASFPFYVTMPNQMFTVPAI